jgi:uncharacterized tellurite resistance protein B-like protein
MQFSELLSLFKSGKTTVRSHMKNLVEMAAVDGNFQEIEYDLLKKIGKRNGVSESQLKAIKADPGSVAFEVPADAAEKFHQLYDLVHMMAIDNEVHAEEQKLCNLFAVKFGYNRDKTMDLIESIRLNIKNGIGHDEAMLRVKMLL